MRTYILLHCKELDLLIHKLKLTQPRKSWTKEKQILAIKKIGAFLKFTTKELVLLILLASIQFSHIVDFMILMPLGPQLMRLLDISPGQFSLLVACYTFSAGISGFMASFYIDTFDRKKILLIFYFGFGLGTLACAFSSTYEVFLLARSLTGVFGGVLSSIVLSVVSDSFAYERRGSAIGVVMASFAMASIFGVPLGLYLSNLFSWHAPFVMLGGVSIIIAASVYFIVPKQNQHLAMAPKVRDPFIILKNIKADRNQKMALLLMFFSVIGHFLVIPFLSPTMVANAGMKESELPMLYFFGGICSMFASPIVGRLSDRFGKHIVFTVSVLLSLIPIYLITNLDRQPLWLVLLISSSFFIVMSGRIVPAMTIVTSTASPQNRAGFLSVSSSVQQLSSAFAAWIAGVMIIEGPEGQLLYYSHVGYLAMVSSLLAILVAWRVQSARF